MARVMHNSIPHESPAVAASLAVTVILVVGSHLTTELALERFTGVVIGALFALVASFLASPTRETQKLALVWLRSKFNWPKYWPESQVTCEVSQTPKMQQIGMSRRLSCAIKFWAFCAI